MPVKTSNYNRAQAYITTIKYNFLIDDVNVLSQVFENVAAKKNFALIAYIHVVNY